MIQTASGLSNPTAVVVSGAKSGSKALLARAASEAGGDAILLRSRGRRHGATQALVADLLNRRVATVVVPSLAALHPSVASQLAILSTLLQHKIRVVSVSPTESWVTVLDPTSVSLIAGLLAADEHRRASQHGRAVVAQLRQRSARVGRPRTTLKVALCEAQRLVGEKGWRRAARTIGTSPATLRRLLREAGLLPAPRRAA